MDEAAIEAQVQKELDAISLSSFNSEEEVDEGNISILYNDEEQNTDTMQLYMEKSSERNRNASDILRDAEDLLTMYNSVEQTSLQKSSLDGDEQSNALIEYQDIISLPDSKTEAISKTTSEIEDENRVKLEDLENRLKQQEEEYNIGLEKKKISDEEDLHQWESRESKVQKNLTVMLDKANYWEKTYDQLAHEEFATKEQDLEKEFLESQGRIELIQEEQKKILQDLLKEKEELDRKRNKNSATLIQKTFRGYSVRKVHGQELKKRICHSKERRRNERIAAIEKRQAEMRAAKQKEEEENKKKINSEKENEKKDAPIAAIEDQISNKRDSSFTDKNKTFSELIGKSFKIDSKSPSNTVDATISHPKANSENTQIADDNFSLKTDNLSTTILSFGDAKNENITVGIDTISGIQENLDARENTSVSKPDQMLIVKKDINEDTVTLQSNEPTITTAGVENENDMKNVHPSLETDHPFPLSVSNKTKTLPVVENKTGPVSSKASSNEVFKKNHSKHKVSTDSARHMMENEVASNKQANLDKNLTAFGASLEENTKPVSESENVSKIHDACLDENGDTDNISLAPTEECLMKNSVDVICEHIGIDVTKESDFESSEKISKENSDGKIPRKFPIENIETKVKETATSVSTQSVANVAEYKHPSSSIGPISSSNEVSPVTNNVTLLNIDNDIIEGFEKDEEHATCNTKPFLTKKLTTNVAENNNRKYESGGDRNTLNTDIKELVSSLSFSDAKKTETGSFSTTSLLTNETSKTDVDEISTSQCEQKELDRDIMKLASLAVENDTGALNSQTDEKLHQTFEGEKKEHEENIFVGDPISNSKGDNGYISEENCHQTNPEFNISSYNKSHSYSIAPVVESPVAIKSGSMSLNYNRGFKHSELNTAHENDLTGRHSPDESHSYSDALKLHRHAWLERVKSKVRKEWISPSVSKRRRLIRISSAAKRLMPFSDNAILDGGYLLPDCRVDRKISDLEKAKCIVLCDIEGGRNLSSISRCAHLSHLTVRNCGIVSLEGLQSCPCLKYIDASHNAVNMMSCSGMKRLEVLDVSHNRLTSIHGLEGCDELVFLDLSHNNITKLSGLEDARKLLHIRISNNQVINASGVSCCENLLYMDISDNHLVNLDDFENCMLLFSLNASGNNLEKIGTDFLENAVLLTMLDVSRNSLQSLGMTEDTFLPFLAEFNTSINRITSISENTNFSLILPFLSDMNMSKNLLSTTKHLRSIASCQCLHKVDLADNPLATDSGDEDHISFLRMLPEIVTKSDKNLVENSAFNAVYEIFCPLRNFGKNFVNLISQSDEDDILNIISNQLEKLQSEVKRHSTELQRSIIRWKSKTETFSDHSNVIHPPQMLSDHASHLKKLFDLALYFRNLHDSETMTYTPISGGQGKSMSPAGVEITGKAPDDNNDTFTAKAEHDKESQHLEKLVRKDVCQDSMMNTVRASRVYDQLLKRNVSDGAKETAATQIQAFWKGCRVRRKHQVIRNHKISATIKIQAAWRGYLTRKKIQQAMKLLKQEEPETQKQEEFEDIDLDGFNFDEKSFDEQWAYKVSGFDKLYSEPEEIASNEVPVFQNQRREDITQPFTTPVNYEHMGMAYSKPPLPPIPSRTSTPLDTRLTLSEINSTTPSIADSAQTKRSAKQEVLSNEWGIKSSSTADLMMRRARRMKGGRKKNHTADEKLQRFQEKTSVFHNSEITSHRKHENPNKIEYFKAREQGYSLKNKISAEEDEQKRLYTYEWLHNQVGSHYDPHHKTSPPRKVGDSQTPTRTSSSGFFPAIPKSPSLVGNQDLEIVSVSSTSSYMDRSKQRLRDIARRHNPSYTGQSR